jgi:hypothetical protein
VKAAAERTDVEEIADEINELRPYIKEAHTCPEDEGVAIYALFYYPGEAPVLVEVRPGGCASVSNVLRPQGGFRCPAGTQQRFAIR